jgi:hypothetical protein
MKYPYWLVFLLAIDRLGAALLFNRPDITISALCWVARYAPDEPIAASALHELKLYQWQFLALLWIGSVLEWIQPGHCIKARTSDILTSQSTTSLLT